MPLTKLQLRRLLDTIDTLPSKDEVILHLAASKATKAQRQTAYRMWCARFDHECRQPDVSRVVARRRSTHTRWLFE